MKSLESKEKTHESLNKAIDSKQKYFLKTVIDLFRKGYRWILGKQIKSLKTNTKILKKKCDEFENAERVQKNVENALETNAFLKKRGKERVSFSHRKRKPKKIKFTTQSILKHRVPSVKSGEQQQNCVEKIKEAKTESRKAANDNSTEKKYTGPTR